MARTISASGEGVLAAGRVDGDEVKLPHASGAICVCGKCGLAMELHPVPQCPYEYEAIKQCGRRIAYYLRCKKPEKEPEKNGLRSKEAG